LPLDQGATSVMRTCACAAGAAPAINKAAAAPSKAFVRFDVFIECLGMDEK
jgi:hypothetical protein